MEEIIVKEEFNFQHKDIFRRRALNWLLTMQINQTRFRMVAGGGQTIFTSCFALFLLYLLRKQNVFPQREKDVWAAYINSFQDKDSGYYVPANYNGELHSKVVHQLTCFCLSALHIVDGKPQYPFTFLKKWLSSENVEEYVRNIGCFKGKPMTGNMAMFLAIFLTYQYETHKDLFALDQLNKWFNCHNKAQNPRTGFWGNSIGTKSYAGFQNAFHQFLVYSYWGKPVQYHTKIVDTILSLQAPDGFFAPYPGGGGCWDYDAADILINCGYYRGYKQEEIKDSLIRLLMAILASQNTDGGFCESQKRPMYFGDVFSGDNKKFILSGHDPSVWYYRLRTTASISRSKMARIYTHWTSDGRLWNQSDLWNTWFRCLTIVAIDTVLSGDQKMDKTGWHFHKSIGLGYFRGK
ncbi:MAG: hypothetical protein KKH94_12655 [Candidatus Omnitrophica bacterium]|nr:hypothetical protein [Candidatus Omnitrophota bacterium]